MGNVGEWVNKNLPAIFTGGSMFFAAVTVPLAVLAGVKTKEKFDEMEGEDTIDKVKAVAPYYIAPVATAGASMGLAYAAHKENSARYAALAGTLVITQKDNKYLKQFKDAAEEKLGAKKTEEVKADVAKKQAEETTSKLGNVVPATQECFFHDLETGYVYKTTMNKFWKAVNYVNDLSENNIVSISDFYEYLLGDDYVRATNYDHVGFGPDCSSTRLVPNISAEVSQDLSLVYTVDYSYADIY